MLYGTCYRGKISSLTCGADEPPRFNVVAGRGLQQLEECRAVNPGIGIVHAGTRQIYGRPLYGFVPNFAFAKQRTKQVRSLTTFRDGVRQQFGDATRRQ
jgi:hypothetical protein